MPLPLLATPTFELIQPSTGKPIEYRPFLVKEEKNLLIALEADDEKETSRAVKNIIKSCVISTVDVEKLPSFDIEYIFLNIRSKSVGELIELQYHHIDNTNNAGDECKHVQNISVDVNEITCVASDDHSKKVHLTDTIGIVMKYPTLREVEKAQAKKSEVDSLFSLISSSVESVWEGEDVTTEFADEEMDAFIESMTNDQFEKLKTFFDTMPRVRYTIEYTCGGCGEETKVDIEGLQSFFT
jgi:hypothetical protein